MTIDRRIAKALYWVGGHLSKIQTSKRTYRIVTFDPFVTEPAGKVKSPCSLSMKLLGWSMQWDWDHWDHWATTHSDHCNPVKCRECGDMMCHDELTISLGALRAMAEDEPLDEVVQNYGTRPEAVNGAAPYFGRVGDVEVNDRDVVEESE